MRHTFLPLSASTSVFISHISLCSLIYVVLVLYRTHCKYWWMPLPTAGQERTPHVSDVLELFADRLWMCHLSEESTKQSGCSAQVGGNVDLTFSTTGPFVFYLGRCS